MEFRLPELGEGVHEGELLKWCVNPGDQVVFDQPLCEVMTDKASIEIPSAVSGKVHSLHAKVGQMVQVGTLLIQFESEGSKDAIVGDSKDIEKEEKSSVTPVSLVQSNASSGQDVLAAPVARRMARQMGVSLSSIQGSGPKGRVLKEDLLDLKKDQSLKSPAKSFVSLQACETQKEERVSFRGLRKKISERMQESKRTAAHFTLVEEFNATNLVKLRKELKPLAQEQGVNLTYLPFVMKAMVQALKAYPILNSTLDEKNAEIVIKHYFNFGLSVQTDEGLMAPVVHNVDKQSILELARTISDLAHKARSQKLKREELIGGTMTLTSLGAVGGLFATPVINFPEVAILGFNRIFQKAAVVNGAIEIQDSSYLSLSLDHRIVDGAVAANFLGHFIQWIEHPQRLLIL